MASVAVKRNFIEQVKGVEGRLETASRGHMKLYNLERVSSSLALLLLINLQPLGAIELLINKYIEELSVDTKSSIGFELNNQFEIDIEQLGSIKLNGQTNISPTRTFPPQVKFVVPDYKAKQLPPAYCCNNSDKIAPGELNCPKRIAVHY
ncbi:hypothetical protein LOD99_5620 [Oopsacas minuta]|uniref:Uncharacterized protein n=1 Tax=Oopsacas minuta TaxID=111878 RepID=A0AAV7JPX5_9METZ|nr:hypothetical protein LOD99_5620 [Oopsacas minuta]